MSAIRRERFPTLAAVNIGGVGAGDGRETVVTTPGPDGTYDMSVDEPVEKADDQNQSPQESQEQDRGGGPGRFAAKKSVVVPEGLGITVLWRCVEDNAGVEPAIRKMALNTLSDLAWDLSAMDVSMAEWLLNTATRSLETRCTLVPSLVVIKKLLLKVDERNPQAVGQITQMPHMSGGQLNGQMSMHHQGAAVGGPLQPLDIMDMSQGGISNFSEVNGSTHRQLPAGPLSVPRDGAGGGGGGDVAAAPYSQQNAPVLTAPPLAEVSPWSYRAQQARQMLDAQVVPLLALTLVAYKDALVDYRKGCPSGLFPLPTSLPPFTDQHVDVTAALLDLLLFAIVKGGYGVTKEDIKTVWITTVEKALDAAEAETGFSHLFKILQTMPKGKRAQGSGPPRSALLTPSTECAHIQTWRATSVFSCSSFGAQAYRPRRPSFCRRVWCCSCGASRISTLWTEVV